MFSFEQLHLWNGCVKITKAWSIMFILPTMQPPGNLFQPLMNHGKMDGGEKYSNSIKKMKNDQQFHWWKRGRSWEFDVLEIS